MEKATFEKVSATEKILYGPRKILLCGFPADARPKFDTVLGTAGLSDLPRVWATDAQADTPITELMELPDGTGASDASSLPRAVIVAGIKQAELIGLMNLCKQSGMQPALWAVLTPVSTRWSLRRLIDELAREREALKRNT